MISTSEISTRKILASLLSLFRVSKLIVPKRSLPSFFPLLSKAKQVSKQASKQTNNSIKRADELQKVKGDFLEINTRLAAMKYPEFEPQGITAEELQELWETLELAEKNREEALKQKHELAQMEEGITTLFLTSSSFL